MFDDVTESKDLQELIGKELFSSENVGSELDSVISVLERHGSPLDFRQARALSLAQSLCPDSDIIRSIGLQLDAARYKSISPDLFLKALDAYTLADRVTGRLPLSKAFNAGGDK
ncbi:hypothetical protein REC12_15435 [Desulfosporosinus sp. PR]|uniref:hypothetical protein n=1 Tax=Candidatus Desulfosporosinus nitrosoreducens TaxID=3401928 RepID=UPI0027EE57A3|nr:hypothetical protein [Desulfosporosinus sp. PR]MDQ7094988.1 hypothetical protein [Desulfosporosinus sp. PR]